MATLKRGKGRKGQHAIGLLKGGLPAKGALGHPVQPRTREKRFAPQMTTDAPNPYVQKAAAARAKLRGPTL